MYEIKLESEQAKLFLAAIDWFDNNEQKEHQVVEVVKEVIPSAIGGSFVDRKIVRKFSVNAFVADSVDLDVVTESYSILVWYKSVELSREQLLNVIKFCCVIKDLMKEKGE